MRKRRINWENKDLIEKIIKEGYSYSSIVRKLNGGKPKTGSQIQALKKFILIHGIDISHFLPIHLRTSKGTVEHKKQHFSNEQIFALWDKRLCTRVVVVQRYSLIRPPRFCSECGIFKTWNNKPLVLQLDHVDGNSLNNTLANLRWLCPNCHSQTETFSCRKIKWPSDDILLEWSKRLSCKEIGKIINAASAHVGKKLQLARALKGDFSEDYYNFGPTR